MSEMPDLSKIVSLIMENPELISKIQGLAKAEDAAATTGKEEVAVEKSEAAVASSGATSVAASAANADVSLGLGAREKRNRLLYAMKPYLSSERAKAIDSMMSVADIIDMIKTR